MYLKIIKINLLLSASRDSSKSDLALSDTKQSIQTRNQYRNYIKSRAEN